MKDKIIKYIVFPLLIFIVFFVIYSKKAVNSNSLYYYDEYSWIGRGYYFELLINGDFNNKLWEVYNVDADPKLASYIYGLANYPTYKKVNKKNYDMFQFLIDKNMFAPEFQSERNISSYIKYYQQKKDYLYWNKAEANGLTINKLVQKYGLGIEESLKLILRARKIAVIFFCLSILTVYFIGGLFFNNLFLALILSIFYGGSFLLSEYGVIAYTEPIFLFFFNTGLFLIIKLLNNKILRRKRIFFSILLGVIIAFTNQTRLNGILLLFIYYAAVFLNIIDLFKRKQVILIKEIIFSTIITTISAFTIYILLDPFLYTNTFKNIIFQYQGTYQQSINQYYSVSHISERLATIKERILFVYQNFFKEQYSYILPYYLVNSFKTYTYLWFLQILTKNILLITFNIFFVAGFISLITRIKKTILDYRHTVLLVYFLVTFFSTIISLSLAWGRYTILLILPFNLIILSGFVTIYRLMKKILSKTRFG